MTYATLEEAMIVCRQLAKNNYTSSVAAYPTKDGRYEVVYKDLSNDYPSLKRNNSRKVAVEQD